MRVYLFPFFITFLLFSCQKEPNTLFVEVEPDTSGIHFNNFIVESDTFNILTDEYIFNGGGVAVGDFNKDGKPDLYFTGNQVANKLYLNQGDFKFEDITAISKTDATDRWSTGVTVVDINGDGWLDIYVCAAMYTDDLRRANMLFVNQGLNDDGIPVFEELAESYGIAETGNSMMATFFDFDLDGHLDLYVLNNEQSKTIPSNFREKITDGTAINNDRLYRNNGNGTFSDVTIEAGITTEGFGLGIAVSDINMDGWPDIYISNDYVTNDILYINNQDGTFSNRTKDLLRHQSMFSMGSDISDYNNDGYLDIITLDMLGETNARKKTTISKNTYQSYINNETWGYEYQHVRNMLHVGNGPEIPFSEIGFMSGVYQTDWSWSPLFVDMDNDGHRDLLITNGFPRDITDKDFANYRADVGSVATIRQLLDSIPIVKIPNYAFRNKENWTFENVYWGLDKASFSNGAVYVDLDGDGALDYVVNNINDPAFVFKNTLKTGSYLRVKLEGDSNNPMGIGAKLVLRFENGTFQYHEQQISRGYMSAVEDIVHFGLGDMEGTIELEILWPNGAYQKVSGLNTNQLIKIQQNEATRIDVADLVFPFTPKRITPFLSEVSDSKGISYIHKEEDKIDYNVQRTLPHKLTQFGPSLVVGDVNGDGLEDFIVGSAADFAPTLFIQATGGDFTEKALFKNTEELRFEEMGMVLFDVDNDGDLDLYLVSGSSEFRPDAIEYVDRLYLNDGSGNFSASEQTFDTMRASGSVVKTADFDGNGWMDLFVGGRTPIAQYPLPDKSQLLRNNKGVLEDVTELLAPGLREVGMVTDALWSDVDNDGLVDLVVVGELMAITIFKNTGDGFKKLKDTGLENHLGWWNSIAAGDFTGNGHIDYIVGNMGSNNYYHPTVEKPVRIYAKDFDNNQSIDPIIFTFFKNHQGDYLSVPAHYWDDLYGQSTLFRRKFTGYKGYALATEETLFSPEELEGAIKLEGNFDRSSFIENLGNGKFKVHELPTLAQLAPVNGTVIDDINGDGHLDVLLVGNDYGNEVFSGRYDAFTGLVLLGDGQGNFEAVRSLESGFQVFGDAKAMARIQGADGAMRYIATQNRGKLKLFESNNLENQKSVYVPEKVQALEVQLENGSKHRVEVRNQSGFLSNSSAHYTLPANVAKVEGIGYDGKRVAIELENPINR